MMQVRRRALILGVGAAALGAVVSCLSPTLPLPPPGEPTVEEFGTNQYRLTGTVPGPGWVVVANDRTSEINGDITEGDGQYAIVVVALIDDPMRLWYTSGGEQSPSLEFTIRDLLPSASEDGPAAPEARDAGP
jgi:hypothetical protein